MLKPLITPIRAIKAFFKSFAYHDFSRAVPQGFSWICDFFFENGQQLQLYLLSDRPELSLISLIFTQLYFSSTHNFTFEYTFSWICNLHASFISLTNIVFRINIAAHTPSKNNNPKYPSHSINEPKKH